MGWGVPFCALSGRLFYSFPICVILPIKWAWLFWISSLILCALLSLHIYGCVPMMMNSFRKPKKSWLWLGEWKNGECSSAEGEGKRRVLALEADNLHSVSGKFDKDKEKADLAMKDWKVPSSFFKWDESFRIISLALLFSSGWNYSVMSAEFLPHWPSAPRSPCPLHQGVFAARPFLS